MRFRLKMISVFLDYVWPLLKNILFDTIVGQSSTMLELGFKKLRNSIEPIEQLKRNWFDNLRVLEAIYTAYIEICNGKLKVRHINFSCSCIMQEWYFRISQSFFTSWAKLRSYKISFFFFFFSFFLFLNFSWIHFSNLQISTVLTIFHDRFDGLLLKWGIIIFFSGIPSGFRIFSGFFRILFKS